VSAPGVIDITFERITQKFETDLAFLKRLALEYGYDFTIRGVLLVFYSRSILEALPPVQTLTRTDLETFEFRNRSHATYLSAGIAYHDPITKSLTTQSATAVAPIAAGDTLKLVSRCENGQQAALQAQAALDTRDMFFMDATLTMPGAVTMAAGTTISIVGFGEFDGIYIILVARHRLDRAHGYITKVEVTRVF
jgi:phage protein D